MALLKGNWCVITYIGMEIFPIVVVFYPYPKIVQQLLWITDQTSKDLKFIFECCKEALKYSIVPTASLA
jgi:hypothetical protein